MPLHEIMHNILSSRSDGELKLLIDVMTEFTEQIREESKNYVVVFDYPIIKKRINPKH
jgi:hypothetical protein